MGGIRMRSMARLALLLPGLWAAFACGRSCAGSGAKVAPAPRVAVHTEPVALELNGFNYTDLYIDSFEVNGQGGGNLFVSSPTSGGGGSACCVMWTPGTTPPVRVQVKWTRDRKRWCEQEVAINTPLPEHPRHLAVHFFPDGHIEAEITEEDPSLKLRLEQSSLEQRRVSGNTVADEQTSRCHHDRE